MNDLPTGRHRQSTFYRQMCLVLLCYINDYTQKAESDPTVNPQPHNRLQKLPSFVKTAPHITWRRFTSKALISLLDAICLKNCLTLNCWVLLQLTSQNLPCPLYKGDAHQGRHNAHWFPLNIAHVLPSLTKARANWHPGNNLLLENQLFYKSGSFSAPNNIKNDCYG